VAQRSGQTRRAPARHQAAAAGGQSAYERLNASVEAAQAALKELRGELGRGSRELLKDVELTLRDARKNLRSVSRQIVNELEQVQQAAAGKRAAGPAPKGSRGRSRATTTRKRTTGT
jgi:predicted  nucleic acid-binding Zn-ribbon protein